MLANTEDRVLVVLCIIVVSEIKKAGTTNQHEITRRNKKDSIYIELLT